MQVRVVDVPEVPEQVHEDPIPEPFKPKRIFIGRVPSSWGFGAQPRVTDHEPLGDEIPESDIRSQQQRGRGAAPRPKLTVYIGKKPRPLMPRPVFVVAQPDEDESEEEGQGNGNGAPGLDGLDDAISSPLTSLTETETEGSGDVDGEDGECWLSSSSALGSHSSWFVRQELLTREP